MNKPPERLRVHFDELGTIIAVETRDGGFGRTGSRHGKLTEHFYVLEKEPMEKKTENLTTQEAWAAMARGECVKSSEFIYRIKDCAMEFWCPLRCTWFPAYLLDEGPYSIVPDPSKPVVSEYEIDKGNISKFPKQYGFCGDPYGLIRFIEKHFQRKP